MSTFSKLTFYSLVFWLQISESFAQASPDTGDFSNTTFGKIMIALVSAFMSLLVGYILLYLKERREPAKRISYNAEFKKGLIGIEERISKDVKFMYKGIPVDKLSYVKCDVANTGSSVIRREQLRFEYPRGIEILDYEIEPTPPKESGLECVIGVNDLPNERSFTIAQFNRAQLFSFNFVLKGEATGGINIFGKNEEEDVEIVAKEISSTADDTKTLESFIFVFLLTLFVPHVLSGIPDVLFGRFSISDVVDWLFWIVVTVVVLRYLPVVSHILAQAITKFRMDSEPTISFRDMSAKGSIVIANRVAGGLEQTTHNPEQS